MEHVVSDFPIINQLIDLSKDRFQAYCQNGGDVSSEMLENQFGLMAPWTSIILISGSEYRLTFKVHFPIKTTSGLVLSSDENAEKKDYSHDLKIRAKIFDYLKEFCNFYGGSLKRAFADSNVNMGISLPMLTRGFDEVFFPRANFRTSFEVYWGLKNSLADFRCSLYLETTNIETLKTLSIKLDDSNEGEIEFL